MIPTKKASTAPNAVATKTTPDSTNRRGRSGRPNDQMESGADESAQQPGAAEPLILIVDDDPEIRLALETYFRMEHYSVMSAEDGVRALELMAEEPGLDLVLLDVVLPRMNGFEVLQKSETLGYTTPVLMMSGRGDQENILKGFGLGAQDYIVKPFLPEDLFERTEALIGRDGGPPEPLEQYEIGSYVIDFQASAIRKGERRVTLSEMEIDILRCLVQNRGCVVTKKRLLREAWHIDDDLISHTINPDIAVEKIDRHVQSIRRKLEPNPSKPRFIHTVYGLGYRLKD